MAGSEALKCPTPFVSADASTCVMPCPSSQQFVRMGSAGSYTCTYQPDPSKATVPLVTVGAVAFNGSSLEDLQAENPVKHAEFTTEKDRFDQAVAVAYANIDKKQRIQDAFRALQSAENARDQSPSAYQLARTAYYTLLKGDDWLTEERQRITASEVAPEIQRYRDAANSATLRMTEQQGTIDVINGLKDKVLSLKDDFQYSVTTFGDQLEKVKSQLNMSNRSRDKGPRDNTWTWIDIGLNVLLVAVLLYAVFTFIRRYFIINHLSMPSVIPSFLRVSVAPSAAAAPAAPAPGVAK